MTLPENEDTPDASLDETLQRSPFMATSMFDIIEGSSVLIMELIDLLIASGAISSQETRKMFDRLDTLYVNRPPGDLAAFTVNAAKEDFLLSSERRVHAAGQRLHARRMRENRTARRPDR